MNLPGIFLLMMVPVNLYFFSITRATRAGPLGPLCCPRLIDFGQTQRVERTAWNAFRASGRNLWRG